MLFRSHRETFFSSSQRRKPWLSCLSRVELMEEDSVEDGEALLFWSRGSASPRAMIHSDVSKLSSGMIVDLWIVRGSSMFHSG